MPKENQDIFTINYAPVINFIFKKKKLQLQTYLNLFIYEKSLKGIIPPKLIYAFQNVLLCLIYI